MTARTNRKTTLAGRSFAFALPSEPPVSKEDIAYESWLENTHPMDRMTDAEREEILALVADVANAGPKDTGAIKLLKKKYKKAEDRAWERECQRIEEAYADVDPDFWSEAA